ncbi:MAG TPA: GNAT family N-acetyltransferase [Actinocrinis sp.]|nr:GNAT family N-acetyltransferase [Actinocrinis sp.]
MTPQAELSFRRARREDVPALIDLLADDPLGRNRETPADPAPYYAAFEEIDGSPAQYLAAVESDGEVVGTLQITVIPNLGRGGMKRCLIEAVHIRPDAQGRGLGTRMMQWAIDYAREAGCGMVQLTSHRTRTDAHRFYERLGFEDTHAGFKLYLGEHQI